MRALQFMFIFLLTIVLAACDNGFNQSTTEEAQSMSGAEVVFYDVGQGDSTLLRDQETTILIDTGRHDDPAVLEYLEADGVQDIDLLILTHPHADHIGQADVILENYDVEEVWMNGQEHTSATYERVIDAVLESEAAYEEPSPGDVATIGGFEFEVLNPYELTSNLNDGSLAMRVTYDGVSVLFTGDAEREAEENMMQQPELLNADVFHVGHHGSSTSNGEEFLQAVDPEVAIYSADVDSEYGHPHDKVVERFEDLGIELFGTAEHGEVYVIIQDGEWELFSER
ncbi:ComEC/Rec2 family competence protein [Geomicrobium sediminis]|uniref:Beta-lactamase superfamily II metal-dependent hydrolase n=1 Tax=Geomicrobium sediminis TaxID=1347788 RepID=A0ABS2PHZ9_9BACL|nr:ComEC/Rec2 family competence protein [Geomicrobium sediminis]MBM7635058.1 beta-lactamase superfamily II metal-dependent hydrolase [Geomicrobium sediminis]